MMLLMALAVATTPEAEALGLRLARTGMLDQIAALATASETEQVIKDHPAWTPDQQAKLRTLGKAISARHREAIAAAMGKGYAANLSITDLRALVAFEESATAKHWHDAMPQVLGGTMKVMGSIDFKGDLRTAFCKDEATACEGWKK